MAVDCYRARFREPQPYPFSSRLICTALRRLHSQDSSLRSLLFLSLSVALPLQHHSFERPRVALGSTVSPSLLMRSHPGDMCVPFDDFLGVPGVRRNIDRALGAGTCDFPSL